MANKHNHPNKQLSLVKGYATEKNKHSKTGTESEVTQEVADHLIAKGLASDTKPKESKKEEDKK